MITIDFALTMLAGLAAAYAGYFFAGYVAERRQR